MALIHLSSLLAERSMRHLPLIIISETTKILIDYSKIIYHLGKVSSDDYKQIREREVHFSAILKERVGHHYFGEKWATNVKKNSW